MAGRGFSQLQRYSHAAVYPEEIMHPHLLSFAFGNVGTRSPDASRVVATPDAEATTETAMHRSNKFLMGLSKTSEESDRNGISAMSGL